MELYTDTYYIQRIQAGDTACFACLLDKYSRPVHSLILKVVRNREDAEELAQDVFMKVFKHLSSFKGECSFSTWIYRIAYNTAISETRKKRHEFLAIEESVINNVSEQEVAEALDRTDSSDQIQMLDAALAQLPPDERAIILLFYMKEKTIDEVATITGLTASNIKVKLYRIRKKLFFVLKEWRNNKMTEKNDILKDLFSRMPEEELPASFRANAMRQIMAEARTDTQTQRTLGMDCRHRRLAAYGRYRDRFIPLYEYFPNIRTDPQYEHTPLLCLYRDTCPHPAGSRLPNSGKLFKRRQMSQKEKM